jgi:hypothetical protein
MVTGEASGSQQQVVRGNTQVVCPHSRDMFRKVTGPMGASNSAKIKCRFNDCHNLKKWYTISFNFTNFQNKIVKGIYRLKIYVIKTVMITKHYTEKPFVRRNTACYGRTLYYNVLHMLLVGVVVECSGA